LIPVTLSEKEILMIARAVCCSIALALVATLAAAQQPPAKPPKPTPAPVAPQAPRPPEAPQPPRAEAPESPPAPQARNQPVNVRVEVTITEQRGKAAPSRKLLTIIAADGFRNAIRSQETFVPMLEVPLNVDVMPTILTDNRAQNTGKIRLILNLEYDLPGFAGGELKKTASGEWERMTTKSSVRENLIMILDDGKPLVAAQSADPVSDRQVTVEVRATVIK
jgi:hypothetical protein